MSTETGITHHSIHWLVEKVSILFNKLVNYPPEEKNKTKQNLLIKSISARKGFKAVYQEETVFMILKYLANRLFSSNHRSVSAVQLMELKIFTYLAHSSGEIIGRNFKLGRILLFQMQRCFFPLGFMWVCCCCCVCSLFLHYRKFIRTQVKGKV